MITETKAKAKKRPALEFQKTPQRRVLLACFQYRRYASTCIYNRSISREGRLPIAWRALVRVDGQWQIISRHRTRRAAERACRDHLTARED